MFQEERKQKICDLVNRNGSMKVSDLARILNTSEVTIRRDLDDLCLEKWLQRTHGGAISNHNVRDEIVAPELIRMHKNYEEKMLVARAAYSLLNEKDTLFMDGSSTVHELVKLIAEGEKKHLYIITSSLSTVSALSECEAITVIMLAGEVNYRHNHVEGHLTMEGIRSMRADKCFIGINGIDASFGFSTPRFVDADMKDLMINSSLQSFILADHSKFGSVYMAKVTAQCDTLITDTRIDEYDYKWLDGRCNVLFADEMVRKE